MSVLRKNVELLSKTLTDFGKKKLKAIVRQVRLHQNPYLSMFLYDVAFKMKYNIDKELTVDYEDENLIFKTSSPELVKSVPTTDVKIISEQGNPHQLLHTERVHLMEYGLKKYFTMKDINEMPKEKKIIMVSPCSGLYLKLFYTHNIYINQALTNDPNDRERFIKLIFNLLRLAPTIDDVERISQRVCVCNLDTEMCPHMKKHANDAPLYLFAHSIYYMKDKLINNILETGSDIIFTAHILKDNTEGKVAHKIYNNIKNRGSSNYSINRMLKEQTKDGKAKSKEEILNPGIDYTMASWVCKDNWVDFNVTDDKLYNHPNFMPILYYTKNVVTDTTITRVDKYFIHENMIHVVGSIIGSLGVKNDFRSITDVPSYKDNYVIQPGSRINKVTGVNLGTIYLNEDPETKRCALMRVFESQTQIITFRSGQFSMWEKLKWHVGSVFTEREYMDFTQAVKIEKKGNILVVSNSALNGLLDSVMNTETVDNKILVSLWKRCLATFGDTAVDQNQIYDIMTMLIYEAVKVKALIYDLEDSDMVKAYNNMLKKSNYSLYTKIYDWIFGPSNQLEKQKKMVEGLKRKQKQQTYIPTKRIEAKRHYVAKIMKRNELLVDMMIARQSVPDEMIYSVIKGNVLHRNLTPTRVYEKLRHHRTTPDKYRMPNVMRIIDNRNQLRRLDEHVLAQQDVNNNINNDWIDEARRPLLDYDLMV
jgi:hypothetical protein